MNNTSNESSNARKYEYKIEALTGVNAKTAGNIVNTIEKEGTFEKVKSTGRKPKASEGDIRLLVRFVQQDPFATYPQVKAYAAAFGLIVDRKTIVSYLAKCDFHSFWATHKSAFTDLHKEARLHWARRHSGWDDDEWKSVVWSDEARFRVENNGCAARVIHKKGTRYQERNILSSTKWEGNMNQDGYVDTLAKHFHPWFKELHEKHGREFILQIDGATRHTDAYARWWKKGHQISGFDFWSAQSPDLNPIEHV
ncbi:Transposable element Tcb1 transposase [Choanephora cucurbitarum]|uniref:Transposable element Tcb1 transposase n=1 Tax=Choanephora cucurbitarum TaxID=101091 RepID=A0A1C7N1K2_9FUNG|nr:Transposable element Tcb1 transposase [Choanephora cucurbitarum]